MTHYPAWHPFSVMPGDDLPGAAEMRQRYAFVSGGRGLWLEDEAGRQYLNLVSAANVVGLGRPEIAERAAEQMQRLSFHPLISGAHPLAARLAERLLQVAPPEHAMVFFANDGSGAMETALKLTRQYFLMQGQPQRKKWGYLTGAYHGVGYGALSVSLPALHPLYEPMVPGTFQLPAPHPYRPPHPGGVNACVEACIQAAEEELERQVPDTVAALVVEPVQSVGGVVPYPAAYFAALRELTRRHGILLIADEVTTGLGRTGAWFAGSELPIAADLIAVAKGLTSGYFPMGATLVHPEIYLGLGEGRVFPHGTTCAGHPVGCAVALAVLDLLESEDMIDNARRTGRKLLEDLRAALAGHPHVGDVRGSGLMVGLELVADRSSKTPAKGDLLRQALHAVRDAGVLAMQEGGVFSFYPPLNLTEQEVDLIVGRLAGALSDVGRAASA